MIPSNSLDNIEVFCLEIDCMKKIMLNIKYLLFLKVNNLEAISVE